MPMVPDEIMEAIHFAEQVVAKEKRDRLGRCEDMVYPMKVFFFHDQKAITGLMGSPFERHPGMDDKDVMSLVVRLFAQALGAKAVLTATEAWNADRCAYCGSSIAAVKDGRCGICGKEPVPPSQNQYRQETLLCTLAVRGHTNACFWVSRIERDESNRISRFIDSQVCTPMEAEGRFVEFWTFEPWMAPHVAVNYPAILEALGQEVDEKWGQVAQMAERMAPAGYPLLRLNVHDLVAVLRRMTIEGN